MNKLLAPKPGEIREIKGNETPDDTPRKNDRVLDSDEIPGNMILVACDDAEVKTTADSPVTPDS